jgi:hypothetical protein
VKRMGSISIVKWPPFDDNINVSTFKAGTFSIINRVLFTGKEQFASSKVF